MHSELLMQNEPISVALEDGTSEGLHTLEGGTQTSSADSESGGPDCTRNGTEGPGTFIRHRPNPRRVGPRP